MIYKNMLVPVVLDEEHNTQASYLVAKVLASDGAKFTVIDVMEATPAYFELEIPSETMARTRREVEKSLFQSSRALPGTEVTLNSGHAGRHILDYADKHDIDCIVVASHRADRIA